MPRFIVAANSGGGPHLRTQSLFRSVRNDFHAELPPARAVELAKENALPAAQAEPAILDENRLRDTRERGLDVRIGVSFGVAVRCVARRQPVKRRFEIPRNVGGVVFIYGQSGGGILGRQVGHAAIDAGRSPKPCNLGGGKTGKETP